MKKPIGGNSLPALGLLASARPLVIGHRGFCQWAPENTLPSFRLAIASNADLVELDYHTSKDGLPVVIHDPELDRTTDACKRWRSRHVKVAAKTAAEIQSLDAGSWFGRQFAGVKVPLLTEALDFIQRHGVTLIERKAGGADDCVNLLRQRNLINCVVVQSFDWQFLRLFHEQEPGQVLGALGPPEVLANGKKPGRAFNRLTDRCLDELQKSGARIAVWNRHVNRSAAQRAHGRGLKVWIYTVDSARLAKQLLEAGVDGIITNNMPLIRKAFGPERRL